MRSPIMLSLFLAALPAGLKAQAGTSTGSAPEIHMIRPGDILKVDVWGHEEFSGQFIVDQTGRLQYPVLGDIDAKAVTIDDLRTKLRQGLETLFKSPFVTISQVFRISVLGEVRAPSLYTVDATLSVLDIIAMAGGPIPGANMSKVRIMRGGTVLRASFNEGGSLQQMGVRSGDQIFVPRKSFTRDDLTTLLNLAQLALTVTVLVVTVSK